MTACAIVVIERALWNTGLSLRTMYVVEILLIVGFNAILWCVVIRIFIWFAGQFLRMETA